MFHFFILRLPVSVTGAVGAVLLKHLTICGGQFWSNQTTADCYWYSYGGWEKHKSMTKPRAFAASAWVNC